jgi:hypothetical protein
MSGNTRRLKVERLMPSASAACVRVWASRCTRTASRTIGGGLAAALDCADAWRWERLG